MTFEFAVHMIALLFSLFVAGALLGALFSKPLREAITRILRRIVTRSPLNPILQPGTMPWTAEATLNPAALYLGDRVHLMYRAIGMDGISRLGYASSADGFTFDDRLPYPAYVAQDKGTRLPGFARRYSPVLYPSGGSWGGCEDPRMVLIDGRVYITFNMFENWVLRVGCISIREEDFLAKKFMDWPEPIVLSNGNRAKNWVLFPEKINGKFAVLHSIIGEREDEVRVEYAKDLMEFTERSFYSPDPQQVADKQIAWHHHVRSAGPPPVKTDRGWLVLYHAHTKEEGHRYKLGAMLLDLKDPTKIICRAHAPILVPDEHYENDGKPGIVYACGTVIKDDILHIYYGGADKVACVATAPLKEFLDAIEGGQPMLSSHTLAAP
jgi:beta-1,2-mannobiose phosphorylase / 1,2-beta-oligomannan phosphorylase